MSNIFEYEFDELPLVIHTSLIRGIAVKIPAALINGMASIRYTRDGEWEIDSICVEGYQELTKEERAAGKRPWIYVPAPPEIADLIETRLEAEWYGKVECALQEYMVEARAEARGAYYERESA
jgi:hypothetical protein